MTDKRVLREIAAPDEARFHDALIAGLSRVAAQIGRGSLADRSGRTTRSLDMLFAGEIGVPNGKGMLDFLVADETTLDELLALYGVKLCPRGSTNASDMTTIAEMAGALARFTDAISDGVRDHNETLAVATLLRPLLPKLTAIINEANELRRVKA